MGSASSPARPRILLRLAQGGMAEVYVALLEDGHHRRFVVLKQIPSARAVSAELIECLREEARLAATLRHPNICQMLAATEDDGDVILMMEYLEGVQLRRLAALDSDLALVAGLLVQTAAGLDHVHEARLADGRLAGIVHRDVTPQNLMVTVTGQVKLLDFGIAKARDTELRTRTGTIKGTPAYLSPEQARGEPVDRRADVFALGSTAVKLLVGEAPFARDNFFATLQAITSAPLPPLRTLRPDLPEEMVRVLARALERDRDRRFASAGAFARELVAALPEKTRPLEPDAIAQLVQTRFGFEIADRRRRIEFAIDELDSEAEPGDLELTAEPLDKTAATVPLALAPAVSRWRRRALVGLVVAALAAAPLVVSQGWLSSSRDEAAAGAGPPPSPSEPDARAPRRAAQSPPSIGPSSARDASVTERESATATADAGAPKRQRRRTRSRRARRESAERQATARAPGYLSVGSTPFATIHVDGIEFGVTPLIRKPLAPGRRRVRAVCSCGKTRELWVTIKSGVQAPPIKLTW